jgi:putative peptidoglycan lipid II flippase
MFRFIRSLVHRRSDSIGEAAFFLGAFSFLSQILGLVRDKSLAHIIGPSQTLDIYYAAFRIPDFLFASIATLASITVILPFLVERLGNRSEHDIQNTKLFLNAVFTVLFGTLAVVSALIAIFMPTVAKMLAPGFTPDALHTLVSVSRIMLLSPLILGVSTMLGAVSQVLQRFFAYALSPVLYNVGIICGIFFLYPHFGTKGLAIGVVFGAVLHFVIQLPVLISHGFIPRFTHKIRWTEIRAVVTTSLPRTLGLSISSLSAVIMLAFVSRLGTGSVSIFNFAYNIQNVPIGVIGIAYSVASFGTLVKLHNEKNVIGFTEAVFFAMRKILFFSVPVVTLMLVFRAQIIRILLGSGAFTWTDTRLTAAACAIFLLSVVAQCLVHVLVRAYYATGNTKTPLLLNILGEVFTVIFAFVFLALAKIPAVMTPFESILRVQGLPHTDMLMLPLAFTLGNIINILFLWWYFLRDFSHRPAQTFKTTLYHTTLASLALFVTGFYALRLSVFFFPLETLLAVILQVAVAGLCALCAWWIVLTLLKNDDVKDFVGLLRVKFRAIYN